MKGARAGAARWGRERGERAKEWFIVLRARAERRFPVITELTARLVSANLFDSAVRLAAEVFLTAVPLLFVVAAFTPHGVRDQLLSSVKAVFGINGAADEQVKQVVNTNAKNIKETSGLIGLVMALLSATACSRAMARVCQRAWRLPKSPGRLPVWCWFAWIAVFLLVFLVQGPLRDGFGVGLWLGVPVSFAVSLLVWWWTQHLLLNARVPWLPLLPGALLTAGGVTALGLSSRLYLPKALNRAIAEYGPLGAVLTMLSWLVAVCAAITFAVTVGAVLAQEPPFDDILGTPHALRTRR